MKIEGVYKFFQNGQCIGEHKNNITETGRILAIKTLIGAVPNFGGSIHLGIDGSSNTYTYIPTQISIVAASAPYTVTLTVASHTLSIGDKVSFSGITVAGATNLNSTIQTITTTTSTTITLSVSGITLTAGTYSSGIGTFGQLASNTRLGFKVNSTPVLSSNIDNAVSYDAILFKAKIDDPSYYKIYEVGLYSDSLVSGATSNRNELLVSFEPGEIVKDSDGTTLPNSGASTRILPVSDATLGGNIRVGSNALLVVAGTDAKTSIGFNLSEVLQTDYINLAYYSAAATGLAKLIFYSNTASATYNFTPVAGYNIQSALISSGTVSGAMDWSNITKIVFQVTTSDKIFDGLRIEKPNTIDTHNGLVSRTSLQTPITKGANSPVDIEYHMRMSFNG